MGELCIAVAPYFVAHPLHFPMGDVSLMISYHAIIINLASLITASLVAGFIPSWMSVRGRIYSMQSLEGEGKWTNI